MRIKFSRSAVKFVEKLKGKDQERIRRKISTLTSAIENQGIIPFKELDIKKLSGDWTGYFRMRIGKLRIIFRIDKENEQLLVYEIDFRGDIYKTS
ncbi:MAG: type II toxin-antitoxin system RelE/ParE family toxin [Aliifodinibius sp.]|nr:type II toxin-antitoxin system RelE/ParE family toxin [Fodinibius sp.]NIV10725.1 type II toxin-antitoxin system RelE/ParE family toxin [Fodinibius sp.]NIY24348.1 type II toxin-antitoxin system RelE/ParE family toxin [Fodinibius sp.]